MSVTRAVVVCIDRYDRINETLQGPCASGLAMILWLLSLDDPEVAIDVCAAPTERHRGEFEALAGKGKIILHEATLQSVRNFLIDDLPAQVAKVTNACLLMHWAGHGFASEGHWLRCGYCADFSHNQGDAFNLSNYLHRLRTAAFSPFGKQILFVDICGKHRRSVQDRPETHTCFFAPERLVYFATGLNEFATMEEDGGVFSKGVIQVLASRGSDWRALDTLSSALVRQVADLPQRPFMLTGSRNDAEVPLMPDSGPSSVSMKDAIELLGQSDDVEGLFQLHYSRTMAGRGVGAPATRWQDALHEMGSMRDGGRSDGVTRALLEFMMRLASEPSLAAAATKWIDRHGRSRGALVGRIRNDLAIEAGRQVLFVEVEQTAQGEVAAIQPRLCHADGSLVSTASFPRSEVTGWDNMVTTLQSVFASVLKDGEFVNTHIHFAVAPQLFDQQFHAIPVSAADSTAIGSMTVVVVRDRARMLSDDIGLNRRWHDYARVLRAVEARELRWIAIDPAPVPVPDAKGLLLPKFGFQAKGPGPAPDQQRKKELRALLRAGAPCVYLLHDEPHDLAHWDQLCVKLGSWLPELTNIDALPERFLEERARRIPLALDASLLWDYPDCNPLARLKGANDR